MSVYCYEEYFNESFDFQDFCEIVASLSPNVDYSLTIPLAVVEVEEYKPLQKKAKKTYAAQIQELKDEILQLREEIEVRDTQLLALIYNKK